ncbi:MAG: glycosyltransferase family 2 protein [Bacteroidetes bacterium]|nr:glycosyltransferase family 2 protein [Bacteroidota bacterium]
MNPNSHYPLVSIISINYNGARVTCAMLESLKKISYPNIEVIIVDNASKEDPSLIANEHPWITFIRSKENLGFAGGNNLGLMEARGKYLLLLNNDTEVDTGFLEPMVKRMEEDPSIGAVSPKIIFHHSPGIIQFAGFNPINPYTGRGTAIGNGQKDDGSFNTSMPTSRAHGAAMMISRKVVEEIGLMADLFFLYYEEMDYCERIKRARYSIWYEAKSTVYHKESISTGKGSTLKTYYLTRNRLLFQRRNVKGIQLFVSILFFMIVSIPKNTLQYVIKGKTDMLKAFWKGILWNLHAKDIHRNESLI